MSKVEGADAQTEADKRAADLEFLAKWLDTRFSLFGVRFGLDTIIGLLPGIGDGATALIGCYLIIRAMNEGVGFFTLLQMIWNMIIDFIFGSIPFFGDIFDIAFRSNVKNAELLRRHLEKRVH